jgi:hypothetical protein
MVAFFHQEANMPDADFAHRAPCAQRSRAPEPLTLRTLNLGVLLIGARPGCLLGRRRRRLGLGAAPMSMRDGLLTSSAFVIG